MAHTPRHPDPGALPTRRRTEQADRRPRRQTSPTTPSTTDGRAAFGEPATNEKRRPARLSSAVLLGPRLAGREETPADPLFSVVADGWDPRQVGEHLAALRRWAQAQQCRAEAAEGMLAAALEQIRGSHDSPADVGSVDLTDLELWADGPPYALFARMRAEAPVRWNPSAAGPGFWSLTRGAEITAVSQDPATFSSARGGTFLRPDTIAPLETTRSLPPVKDPPEHTLYPSIVKPVFGPRALDGLDAVIKNIVTGVLDKVAPKGECDLLTDVALPIPLLVIGALLGSPDEDMNQLLGWTDEIERAMTYSLDVTPVIKQMAAHFVSLTHNQLVAGIGSFAKSLSEAEVDGRHLTEEEIGVYSGMLLYAGNGPTRAAIASGMLALMQHPDQLEAVRVRPSLLRCTKSGLAPAALAEILRWSSPVNYFARTATTDTTVGGVKIKAGDRVVMWCTSANRDPEVIADPDTFNINRSVRQIPHYAFGGGGPHFCHGSSLAIKTLSIALPQIIERLPNIQVQGPTPHMKSTYINSLARLPVSFTPSG